MTRRLRGTLLAVLAVTASLGSTAMDLSFSGFGTLGYAQSDRPFAYQRFINDQGTFRRDSIAGLQIDGKFAERFGTTVQIIAATASDNDRQYNGSVSWAFVSYRPEDDWLFRVGRQRIPFYLYSQSYDVGVTHNFARLPTEMYSISPSNNFDGISFSRSWEFGSGDFALEGYWGKSKFKSRYWVRDGMSPVQAPGAVFNAIEFEGGILVLSYKKNEDTFRAGVVKGMGRMRDGTPIQTRYPFVAVLPGVGYYQVDDSIPGPGVGTVDGIHNTIVTLGADVHLDAGFRVISEFARTYVTQPDVDFANASTRGYASLLKRFGKWAPYVTYAFLRSKPSQRDLYVNVNGNRVPDFLPGAALINASQRAGADGILTYDQSSLTLGISYAFSTTSKVKAELMRVRVGQVSSMVDGPQGSNIRDQKINVFSMAYNFVF